MIGDVNLFLTPSDDDEEEEEEREEDANQEAKTSTENIARTVIGEIEIMIASKQHRGCGLGKEVLNTFMWYILQSLDGIMSEYREGNVVDAKDVCMKYLRVKIDKDNVRSIKLFESVGFKKVTEQPNYFGELELRWIMEGTSVEKMRGRLGNTVKRFSFSP